MEKIRYPISESYRLLESGPVILLTTAFRDKKNIMTLSWHTLLEFDPPVLGCVVSNQNYTFNLLKSTKVCGINIPLVDLAEKVVGCGNTSGDNLDKFDAFHLTPVSSSKISAPLIDECYANLECKVIDMQMVNKHNFFILEVIAAWITPLDTSPQTIHHLGQGLFMIAGQTIQLDSKMK